MVADEAMGETDPLLTRTATAGVEPAGPANKRQPIRIVLDSDEQAVGKGHTKVIDWTTPTLQ